MIEMSTTAGKTRKTTTKQMSTTKTSCWFLPPSCRAAAGAAAAGPWPGGPAAPLHSSSAALTENTFPLSTRHFLSKYHVKIFTVVTV